MTETQRYLRPDSASVRDKLCPFLDAGEHSSLLLRPADSRRNPRHCQRGQGSTSLLSTAMRSTSSRQRRQASGPLHRTNSVASQSAWPNDADNSAQGAQTPASVYGQLTLAQPQISDSPAASTEGNAQVWHCLWLLAETYFCFYFGTSVMPVLPCPRGGGGGGGAAWVFQACVCATCHQGSDGLELITA